MKNILFQKHSASHIRIEDRFYSRHQELRKFFHQTFDQPLLARSKRFCWDYWNVSGQYRLLRTPAESFFGPTLFRPFLEKLLNWGRTQLGCQMVSQPWLSAYVNDCYQDIHSDVPHGPWSFVYSLTPGQKTKFTGGETFIAKPRLLNYFRDYSSNRSDESRNLIMKIPATPNRLIVFDPRYPHGVTRVNGVDGLLDCRLVIHGWFTEPRPMVEGSLSVRKAIPSMDLIASSLLDSFQQTDLSGIFCTRLTVTPSGEIRSAEILTTHLIHSGSGNLASESWIRDRLLDSTFVRFPKSSGTTRITLPIEVKR